jgi:predicted RNA-binding Zn ribbon-like protein
VLARLGRSDAGGSVTADQALDVISKGTRAGSAHRRLAVVRQTHTRRAPLVIAWTWAGLETPEPPIEVIPWVAAQAAAELLLADDVDRWRICPSAACGWMFVDATKNGRRRWCEMATCGTRAKDRRRRGPQRARRPVTVTRTRGGRT